MRVAQGLTRFNQVFGLQHFCARHLKKIFTPLACHVQYMPLLMIPEIEGGDETNYPSAPRFTSFDDPDVLLGPCGHCVPPVSPGPPGSHGLPPGWPQKNQQVQLIHEIWRKTKMMNLLFVQIALLSLMMKMISLLCSQDQEKNLSKKSVIQLLITKTLEKDL